MIISHEHKYLFVELPHTGSTAISKELRENYRGEKILGKHTPYHQFLRSATDEEKNYYTFSGIRNPLDVAVTKYIKYATDHQNRYSDPVKVARNRGIGNWIDRKLQKRVVDDDLDFSSFFSIVYRFPFNTWACLDHEDFNYVMRFENLQEEFSNVLERIGLEQVRPLPVLNSSSGRKADFATYYSPEAIERAKKVFAGYMNEWGYEFPEEWGPADYSSLDRGKYRVMTAGLKLYWRFLKEHMWKKNWDATPETAPPTRLSS